MILWGLCSPPLYLHVPALKLKPTSDVTKRAYRYPTAELFGDCVVTTGVRDDSKTKETSSTKLKKILLLFLEYLKCCVVKLHNLTETGISFSLYKKKDISAFVLFTWHVKRNISLVLF